ncbi:hypothetical protein THAOC_16765 [Thalassiosira oceanica]|uniref:B30.2/SPRY domain-containing protein n=1 Tax=Thalassiosira oceanica TaxID=159749 RepID=K0SBD6_THAOC|nr:hypothetical protein THAOC_16765 [Thalassiosira oceanica]|eukprot:EJK62615.1 hypothetical protein THAOC_16765 [Thalassiosira oceanica]
MRAGADRTGGHGPRDEGRQKPARRRTRHDCHDETCSLTSGVGRTGKQVCCLLVDVGGRGSRNWQPALNPGSHRPLHKSTAAQMMQTRDSKRAGPRPSATLDALGNDLLIRCASYLDVDGLAQLGRTSKRFGIPQDGQQRSLVNEAAHQRFRQSATDEENKCLPKYGDESDIGLYRALDSLRQPLRFDVLAGKGFGPQENPASVTCISRGGFSTAKSGHVMRGGRHFVEVKITGSPLNSRLGVIRPVSLTTGNDLDADWEGRVLPLTVTSGWKPAVALKLRSQRTPKWGDSNVHCCAYHCYTGDCHWTNWDNVSERQGTWQGSERQEGSGTIGLLLDLDKGTLSVFKNGRRLGVMKERLGGEYCWFVAVSSVCMVIKRSSPK